MMLALIVAVVFLAALVRATFGFGEALIAVPLLALLVPVKVATPVAVLVSVTVAAVVVARDWRKVDAGSAWRLVLASLAGIPFGLLLLTRVAEGVVQGLLAVVLMAFAAYSLVAGARGAAASPARSTSDASTRETAARETAARETGARDAAARDRAGWAFGFGAGVLGGAYGMNGPPLVVYGALKGWSPARFRATLQGYYLPASSASLVGYALSGLWTPAVTRYYLWALPAILLGIALGSYANRRLAGEAFRRYVYVFLLLIGLLLLAQAVA